MPRSAGQAVVAVTVLVSWNVNPTPIQMASSLIVAIASRHGRHDRSPHKCMAFYGSLSRFCEAEMDSLGSKDMLGSTLTTVTTEPAATAQ